MAATVPFPIRLCAFTGPETATIQAAEELGLFARHGLAVACTPAPGSIHQMVGLIEGRYDMALTAIDNVIAYDEGQGAAPTDRPADLVGFLGTGTDPRRLVVAPEIASFADLRGKRIAVDALSTGFSFMLRQTLEEHGLGMDDYALVPTGNVPARWDAIRTGDCAGALISTDYADIAVAQGFRRLDAVPDPWEGYQGAVFTADRTWLRDNATEVEGFVRAMLDAVDWVLDAANLDSLPPMMMRHVPTLTPDAAAKAARALQSPGSILKRGLPIDIEGIRKVLRLRTKYGMPPKRLDDPCKYLDRAAWRRATDAAG